MSVFAELEDGRRLEFPDDTDPAVIQATVKKVLGVASEAPRNTEADKMRQLYEASSIIPGGRYLPDIAMGLRAPFDAGAQLATRGLEAISPAGSAMERWAQGQRKSVEGVNAEAQQAYKEKWAPEQYPTGSAIGRGIGESLIGGPLVSKIAPAATVLGRTLQAGGVGAGMGMLSPVDTAKYPDFWKQKATQTGTGAVIGAATGPLTEMASRVISPRSNPSVQALLKEGVTPTPGEVLGGSAKRIEEGIVSLPFIGDIVKSAQRRSIEEFNRAMYKRALAPLGKEAIKIAETAPVGNEGIRKVGDTLSNAYESALARSGPNVMIPSAANTTAVNKAATDFVAAINKAQSMVPRAQRGDFDDAMKLHVFEKITPGGTLTPSVAKDAESALGGLAWEYSRSADAAQRQLGRAFRQAQEELRTVISANNPAIAKEIQKINQGWRTIAQIEKAGAQQGAKGGVFSPSQFMSAVRQGSGGVRKRQFARGEAWNQEFGTAGEAVLSNKLPDSGTIMRGLIAGTALGAGGHFITPGLGVVGTGLVAPYTPMGQRAMAALLAKRPKFAKQIGEEMSSLVPYLGGAASAGLLDPFR